MAVQSIMICVDIHKHYLIHVTLRIFIWILERPTQPSMLKRLYLLPLATNTHTVTVGLAVPHVTTIH